MRTNPQHTPAGGRSQAAGQALVELALVTPVLVLLIMAIFQFAFVLETQMGLTNAVREAARRAAAATATDETSMTSFVDDQLMGAGSSPGLLAENVQGYQLARLGGGAPTVTFCAYDVSGATGEMVDVSVRYAHPVFFPLLSFATDLVDGTPDGSWTLSAGAQMRLEHVLGTPPAATCP